eukprot:UN10744
MKALHGNVQEITYNCHSQLDMFTCRSTNTRENVISDGFAMNYTNQASSIINIYVYHIYIIINQLKFNQIQQNSSKYCKINQSNIIWLYLCINICMYHMRFVQYFSVKMLLFGARINIFRRLKCQYIYNIMDIIPHLSSHFTDKIAINNVFKHFYNIKSYIYCGTKHRILTINDLLFLEKLLLSWDIHHNRKGNIDRTNL